MKCRGRSKLDDPSVHIYDQGRATRKELEVIKIMSLAPNYLIVDKELYRQGL